MKTEIVPIRMDKDMKAQLEKLAKEDNRSLSDYIRLKLTKLINTSKK
jgi:antitoxin component of RelBE/YafQ-DinJ toxin-antitoxin module